MDPTLLDGSMVFTAILQFQVVKLLIAIDPDRFLELDHKFMSTICGLLSSTVACCLSLTIYLTNGTLCDKYNIIHFVHRHGVDIIIDKAMFTKPSITQILGFCILIVGIFRKMYKNRTKIKNHMKIARSWVAKGSRNNLIMPLNNVSIE